MNLVDSCGWLEYVADGKNASFYETALKNTDNLLVPSICVYEVFKKVLQQKGEDAALQVAALMYQGNIAELSVNLAVDSAKISHELKLPLADSIILATAKSYKAVIWTQDEHFKSINGVKYINKK